MSYGSDPAYLAGRAAAEARLSPQPQTDEEKTADWFGQRFQDVATGPVGQAAGTVGQWLSPLMAAQQFNPLLLPVRSSADTAGRAAEAVSQVAPQAAQPFLQGVSEVGKDPTKALSYLNLGVEHVTRPATGGLVKWLVDTGLINQMRHGLTPEQLAAIRQAPGGREAYQEVFRGRPISQFGYEAVADPLNLAGAGLGKQVGKGLVGAAARTGSPGLVEGALKAEKAIVGADTLLDRLQALPLTAPMAAAKAVGSQATKVFPWLEKPLAKTGLTNLQEQEFEPVRAAMEQSYTAGTVGTIAVRSFQDLERDAAAATDKAAHMATLNPYEVGRLYVYSFGDPAVGKAAEAELLKRGWLISHTRGSRILGYSPTERLKRHIELDTALANQQMGPETAAISHGMLDLAATLAHTNNPTKFPQLEDAYTNMVPVRSSFDRTNPVGDLHQRIIVELTEPRRGGSVQELIDAAAPREHLEKLLTSTAEFNPALEQWYRRGAHLLFAMGFDHTPFFTAETAQQFLNQPRTRKMMERFGISDEEALDQVQALTRQDVVLGLMGATSMRSDPQKNFYQTLRAYRAMLDGEDLNHVLVDEAGEPLVSVSTGRQKTVVDMGTKADKATLRMLLPEGLLPYDYIASKRAGTLTPAGAEVPVEEGLSWQGVQDKMSQYALAFRQEMQALERYYSALANGVSKEEAQATLDATRQRGTAFVNDTWNKRLYTPREQWIDPAAVRSLDPASKQRLTWPASAEGSDTVAQWQAWRMRVADDYAYLTGKPNPLTGEVLAQVHPDAAEWAQRLPNPSAYQSRMWALAKAEGGIAEGIHADLSNPNSNLLSRWRQAADEADAVTPGTGDEVIRQLFVEELDRRWNRELRPSYAVVARNEYGEPLLDSAGRKSVVGLTHRLKPEDRHKRTAMFPRLQPTEDLAELAAQSKRSEEAPADVAAANEERRRQGFGESYYPVPKAPGQPLYAAWKDIEGDVQGEGYRLADGETVLPYPDASAFVGEGTEPALRRMLESPTDDLFFQAVRDTANRIRGSFQSREAATTMFGKPVAAREGVIRLFPDMDITTLPHELAHWLRRNLSDEAQAQLADQIKAAGISSSGSRRTVKSEEWFAEAFENALRFGKAMDPRLQALLDRYRGIADASYANGTYTARFDPAFEAQTLAEAGGTPIPTAPGAPTATAAGTRRVLVEGEPEIPTLAQAVDEAPPPIGEGGFVEVLEQRPYRAPVTANPNYTTPPRLVDTALPEDAGIDEVVSRIAGETRLATATPSVVAGRQMLRDLWSYNPQIGPVSALWDMPKYREKAAALLQAPDTASRNTAFADLAREINQTQAAFGLRLPKMLRWLVTPPRQATTLAPAPGRAIAGSGLPADMAEKVQQVVASREYQTWLPKFQAAEAAVKAIYRRRRGKDADEWTTMKDLWALKVGGSKADVKAIDDYFNLSGLRNPNGTMAQFYGHGAAQQWSEAMEKAYGVKPSAISADNDLIKGLRWFRRAWGEVALYAVPIRYHLTNFQDMSTKTLVEGYAPVIGMSPYTMAKKWGIQVPSSVTDPRSSYRPGGATALPEFEAPWEGTALGAIHPSLGKWVAVNRGMSHAMESTFRSLPWMGEVFKGLKQGMPALEAQIRRNFQPNVANAAIKELRSRNLDFSAGDVADTLRRAGGDANFSREAGESWRRTLLAASQRGEAQSNRIHFRLNDERNIEKFFNVRAWAPFHFWATRNVPYYTQTLAQHPILLRNWYRYHEMTEEEKRVGGLTPRFEGKLPLPPELDPFVSAIFGPGHVYFNPIVIMSIADQFKPTAEDPEMPPVGRALMAAGRVGLRPAPWVDIPLTLAGAYGPNQEAGNLIPRSDLVSAAVNAATGLNVNLDPSAAVNAATREARGIPAPLSSSRRLDYQISKRLAEMAVEETGEPGHPDYIAAMTDPSSDLYKRAKQEVDRAELRQRVAGVTVPTQLTHLSPTEAAIRARTADVRDATQDLTEEQQSEVRQQLRAQGDLSTTYASTTDDPREAQVQAGLAARRQYTMPTAAGAFARDQAASRYPLTLRYLEWLRSLPPGADRSVAAFVKTLS